MAAAGLKYQEKEEMLKCSICVEPVNDPNTLQKCLHPFCKACMDKLRAEQYNDPPGVICPVCRKFSEEEIMELTQLHESVKDQKRFPCKPCSNDGKTIDATCRCLDCKERLCADCKAAHQTLQLLKGHKIVELDEDSDMVVDQQIFCKIHSEKHIELYCVPCNALMCMECKVTKHNTHESQTIDEALQLLMPEIENSTGFIDGRIEALAKSMNDVEMRITETKKSYEKCYTLVDETTETRKQQIEEAREKMKETLMEKEKEEIGKLESVKETLKMKQNERQNMKKVVNRSLDRTQHAALLSEYIQGGLQSKIKEMRDQPEAPVKIQVNQPQLFTYDADWERRILHGVLGALVYNIVTLIVATAPAETQVDDSRFTSRYWEVNINEYFANKFKKILEIKTGGSCLNIKLLKEKVWAPMYDGNVNVYDGIFMQTIAIKNPTSVEQAGNGDIFIACHSNSGLYLLDENEAPQKICDGSFADVYAHRDKVYAIEYDTKMIMEFGCRPDIDDVKQRWRSDTQWTVERAWIKDKLIVTGNEDLNFFVSEYHTHQITQYNGKGQLVKKFGSRREGGDGNLYFPRLCGVDRQSHLLVADQQGRVYKILDLTTGQWRSTEVRAEVQIFDAKLDNDGKLWLCQWDSSELGFEALITKHQPQ